jgi:hypothetical protein
MADGLNEHAWLSRLTTTPHLSVQRRFSDLHPNNGFGLTQIKDRCWSVISLRLLLTPLTVEWWRIEGQEMTSDYVQAAALGL